MEAKVLYTIVNNIYEKRYDSFEKLGLKIGLDIRNELIKNGMKEEDIFYSPEWELTLHYLVDALNINLKSGAAYSGLTGELK